MFACEPESWDRDEFDDFLQAQGAARLVALNHHGEVDPDALPCEVWVPPDGFNAYRPKKEN